jgi:hypothetical protein
MPNPKTDKLDFPRLTPALLEHYRTAATGPVDFIQDQCVIRNALDGGRSWIRPALTDLQRRVILDTHAPDAERYHTMLLSWSRKMGKTIIASLLWVYRVVCRPNELVLLGGPTRDAATELAFTACCEVFDRNRELAKAVGAGVQKRTIFIRATGSEIRAVSKTLGANAGADWTVVHVDELWAFTTTELVEHFRVLTTPSPARESPLLCVTSYAPIKGRSTLLEQLLARAKRKEPGLYSSVITGANQIIAACPWISREFLRQMKLTQPAHVFKRVFLNLPVAATTEDDRYMFSRAQIEECTDPLWKRQDRKPEKIVGVVVLGIDFAFKHDGAAIAALVRMQDGTICLIDLAVKHGTRKTPLSASWVSDTVTEMIARYGWVKVVCDPVGITEQIAALKARGIDVTEVSRQGAQLADSLYRAIAGRRLRLYSRAGEVTTADNRRYSLDDELHHLLFDTESRKFGHVGEGTTAGRHFDDRATAIALALQAPELDLANSHAMEVSSWFRPEPQPQRDEWQFIPAGPGSAANPQGQAVLQFFGTRLFGPSGAGTDLLRQSLGDELGTDHARRYAAQAGITRLPF